MISRIPLRLFSPPTIPHTLPRPVQPHQGHLISRISPLRQPILRLQCHRYYSNPSPPPPADTPRPADLRSQFNSSHITQDTVAPQKVKRSLRPYIYAIFLLFGATVGICVRELVLPQHQLPGSEKDVLLVKGITAAAEKLPLVKSLTDDSNWTFHDAFAALPTEERDHRLSTGPLGGSRGLGGFQRIFYNAETGECITVIWLGGAIAGWPGVVHGGAIATILDESLGRCAVWKLPGHTAVTATLQLNYRKPVLAHDFYIVRAIPENENSTPTKQWANAQLTRMNGTVLVEAKSLFVVPKNYKTQPLQRM